MRKNWPFRAGLVLFFGQALAFPTGSPYVLGLVSTACIACLLAGLFFYGHTGVGLGPLTGYTILAAFLIVIAGRALFLVVESLTYDTSADVHVGHLFLTAWGGCLAALVYGIVRHVRSPKKA
jgi:hypothetical protein